MDEIKQGIYDNISINDYHAGPGLSNSGMSLLLQSPAKYYYEYLSGKKEVDTEQSKALIIGQALHVLTLEPELFAKQFYVMPGMDRRTKVGKQQYNSCIIEAESKCLIKQDDFAKVKQMSDSIRSNEVFKKICLIGEGKVENSVFWLENEILLKSRPDWYNDKIIIDVKTTNCASKESFSKSVINYGYHRQAAMQIDGLSKCTGNQYKHHVFLVVESEAPFLTATYSLDDAAIESGRIQYKIASKIYADCFESNNWYGYSNKVETITFPEWYLNKGEL